jgi:hypothetical protein
MFQSRKTQVLLSVLVFLLAVLAMVEHLRCPYLARRITRAILFKTEQSGNDIDFRPYLGGSAAGPGGSTIEVHDYKATDCVRVSTQYYALGSAEEARIVIQKQIDSAYEVTEPTTRLSPSGSVPIERAVVKFEKGGDYFILLRQSNRIREISSRSLSHARLFERKYHFDDAWL